MPSGRWSLLEHDFSNQVCEHDQDEFLARQLLKRYGVVFHTVLQRESINTPWRDIVKVYRRLEARGEIRGGRFVAGFSGEQYALPEALQQLRSIRRKKRDGTLITVHGADPLNLVGILTPGYKVGSLPSNRILFKDGIPTAVNRADSSMS